MKPMFSFGLLVMAGLVLLSGCGGGNSFGTGLLSGGSQNGSRVGQLTLTVQWPAPSRLIPAASNSIVATLLSGNTFLTTQILTRPASGNTSTVTFQNLPAGSLVLTASAFPTANGTGTALAQGSSPVTVVGAQTTPITVNMTSTISTLSISPNTLTLGTGQTATLTATAKDANNNIVLLTPGKLSWSSTNTNAATVDTNGIATGVNTGQALITLTDTESNKSVSIPVVGVTPVSWWKGENNALDSMGTNNGTISGGVTYGTGVSGRGFVFNGVDGVINLGDPPSLRFTSSFTIDCWIKTNAFPNGYDDSIFFRGDDRYGTDPYYLVIKSNGTYYFSTNDANSNGIPITATATLGVWEHVTCTLDGTTGDMRLYVNGVLKAETLTPYLPFANLDPSVPGGVSIGNSPGAPASGYHYPHNGSIDEIKIYNAVVPPTN